MVACLPPCAQYVDKLSPVPLYKKLRSISSLASISQRNGYSRKSLERPPLPDSGASSKVREEKLSISTENSQEVVDNTPISAGIV